MVASHRYEIRVAGVVPPDVVLDFDDLRISVEPVGTVIHGSLPDQAALYALLARLETYHVQLLEFRRCHQTRPANPSSDVVPRNLQLDGTVVLSAPTWRRPGDHGG